MSRQRNLPNIQPYSRMRASLLVSTLLTLTTAAAAQNIYSGPQNTMDWQPSASPNFKGTAAGMIEGNDPLPDLAVLDGTKLYVMNGPGERDFCQRVIPGVDTTAFAVQSRATLGLADRLLVSDSTGIKAYSWASNDTYVLDATIATGTNYANAKSLQADTQPGTGLVRLTGLAANGTTLWGGTLNGNNFTLAGQFTLSTQVQAWKALEWNGSGWHEFVLQRENGSTNQLTVCSYLGTSHWTQSVPLSANQPRFATFYDTSLGSDRVVWTTKDSSGNNILYVFDKRYPVVEPSTNLGTTQPGELLVGDYTGDGRIDLLLSHTNVREAWLTPGATNPTFPGQKTFDANLTAYFPLNYANLAGPGVTASIPSISDFDLDGDLDLYLASPEYGLAFLRNEHVNEVDMRPEVAAVANYLGSISVLPPNNVAQVDHQLDFELPLAAYPPPPGSSSSTAIVAVEVDIFHQPVWNGPLASETPIQSFLFPLTGPNPSSELTIPITWNANLPGASQVWQIRYRMLKSNGSGGTIQAGPSKIIYTTIDQNTYAQIAELDPWSLAGLPLWSDPGGTTTPGGNPKPGTGPGCQSCP